MFHLWLMMVNIIFLNMLFNYLCNFFGKYLGFYLFWKVFICFHIFLYWQSLIYSRCMVYKSFPLVCSKLILWINQLINFMKPHVIFFFCSLCVGILFRKLLPKAITFYKISFLWFLLGILHDYNTKLSLRSTRIYIKEANISLI